jgi:2-phosphosulfolactate phosphatase
MNSRGGRRLGVLFTPAEIDEGRLRGGRAAVVDVLRATSVIPAALAAGASQVVPAGSVDEALAVHASLGRDSSLLCGERQGKMIPGFDLGNSPCEYSADRVRGKALVYLSTNGAPAVLRAQVAALLVTASFVNAGAAVAALCEGPGDVTLVASGNEGRASLEDAACCGFLADRLREADPGFVPDDGAVMAGEIWRSWKGNLRGLLAASSHGAYLVTLGFALDLDYCARVDTVPLVPVFREGRLVPLGSGSPESARAALQPPV